jgi:hypothetical protein
MTINERYDGAVVIDGGGSSNPHTVTGYMAKTTGEQ